MRVRGGCRGGVVESGESSCRQDGLGRVPVGLVGCLAWLGVGAEELAGVVGGDLELLAVGGDDRDVADPLAL